MLFHNILPFPHSNVRKIYRFWDFIKNLSLPIATELSEGNCQSWHIYPNYCLAGDLTHHSPAKKRVCFPLWLQLPATAGRMSVRKSVCFHGPANLFICKQIFIYNLYLPIYTDGRKQSKHQLPFYMTNLRFIKKYVTQIRKIKLT